LTNQPNLLSYFVRIVDLDKLEKVARELENHISILVDYDVIDYQVGDVLTEYVWRIIDQYNNETKPELETVHKLGEKNEVIDLGQVVSKRNRASNKRHPSEG
jgi:hypothetical protein